MVRKLEEGWTKAKSGHSRLHDDPLPDGHRHAGDRGSIPPDRHGPERGRRVPVFALCRGRRRAHRLLVRRRHLHAAVRRRAALGEAKPHPSRARTERCSVFRAVLLLCMRWRRATVALAVAAFVLAMVGLAFVPRTVLSSVRSAGAFRRSAASAERVDRGDGEGRFRARSAAARRSRHRALEHLCRAGRRSLLSADAGCSCRTTSLLKPWCSPRVWTLGSGCTPASSARSRSKFPEVVGRVYPLEMGMPVGWPVQYRVSGPETGARCARSPTSWQSVMAAEPGFAQPELRLDRDRQDSADQGRSGSGETAESQLGEPGASARYRRFGRHDHANSRRHSPDRRRRCGGQSRKECRSTVSRRCRFRCQTGGPSLWCKSHQSSTARSSPSSDGGTVCRP